MTMIEFGLRAAGLSLVLTLAGAPARAQTSPAEPISTAASGAPPPASTAPPAPLPGDAYPTQDPDAPPPRDGKIHGVVEAGVGTNGYRHGMIAIDAPLPNGGDVAIAVESNQIQGGRGR
ncbi:MAG: hypothetical protein JWO72_665 [Caulobacteraceae bacterium]|nr:hypothetical protein [Caulobacteraceae bacterium]